MRISDWSSDVCSSDLGRLPEQGAGLRRMNVSGDMSSAAPGPKVLAEAERWYARLKTSNCSAGQRAAFDRWCADPEHAAAYTQTEWLWEGIGGLAGNPELEALSVQALRAHDPRRR